MPKRVPENAKRVPLNCLVSPETKRLLEKLKERHRSQGEIVDQAVAAWVEFGRASGPVLTKALKQIIDAAKSFKSPLLKPSEKKRST